MTEPTLFYFRLPFIARNVATTNILVGPGLWFGTVLFLLVFHAIPAQAARCSYPTQFYRPSLGVCEAKAGNPVYRAGSTRKTLSKKVKIVRRMENVRSRSTALPREHQAPAVEPEIITKAKAVLVAPPEAKHDHDEQEGFEARWWPVREVSDRHLHGTDGIRNLADDTPAERIR